MYIENLDLETRNKIYNQTKKVLRKYQKGIMNGKITADSFAESILSNGSIEEILEKEILVKEEFKKSYINYIQALINIQNKTLKSANNNKPTISQRLKLKELLDDESFILSIPIDYLNYNDVEAIIKYIDTDVIEVGEERIYNYVRKVAKSVE